MYQLIRTIIFVIALSWCENIFSSTYYFSSSDGNDSRSFAEAQNPSTPWKTITKFNAIFSSLNAGDQVLFKKGDTFFGGMIMNKSGTSGNPITIGAYGSGSKPVVSGFEHITSWTSIGNGRWRSNVLGTGSTVNVMVLNGVNYAKGRYPNTNADFGGYLKISARTGSSVTTASSLNGTWTGGTVVLRTTHWTLERNVITGQSGSTLNYSGSTGYPTKIGFGFFIQDHEGTLDQYGEWYYNASTKQITAYFGGSAPGASAVRVSAVNHLAQIRKSDIKIEGLTFEGANNSSITNIDPNLGVGITIFRPLIRGCEIRYSGIDAIRFHIADDVRIDYNSINHTNNNAINLLYSKRAVVEGNSIDHTGMQPGMGDDGDGNYNGIFSERDGLTVKGNHITNTGYCGIRMGQGDFLLENNFISAFCSVLDDGGGIYTYGAGGDITKRIMRDNIIIHGIGANDGTKALNNAAAHGIFLDDNARDIEINGNTTAFCNTYGVNLHNIQNVKLIDNLAFDNYSQAVIKSDETGHSVQNITVSENVFFSKEPGDIVIQIKNFDAADEITNNGTFTNNHYVRPLNDNLPIIVEEIHSGQVLKNPMSLGMWQTAYSEDWQGTQSPHPVQGYTVNSLTSGNKLTNEGFNSNVSGTSCYSPLGSCSHGWVNSSPINSGTNGVLKVNGPNPSRIAMSAGALSNSKHYIVRFRGGAGEISSMDVYFRQGGSPYADVTPRIAVALPKNSGQDFEILFSNPVSESQTSIQYSFGTGNLDYWVDNCQVYEANVSIENPDDHVFFDYNASSGVKTVTLDDVYVDGKGTEYSGSVNIAPYKSLALTRKGCSLVSICGSGDCPVGGNPISSNTYYATDRIYSSGNVGNGNDVKFRAGDCVELQAGFTVEAGGVFDAAIQSCENQ